MGTDCYVWDPTVMSGTNVIFGVVGSEHRVLIPLLPLRAAKAGRNNLNE
jgi:hypothetical protein